MNRLSHILLASVATAAGFFMTAGLHASPILSAKSNAFFLYDDLPNPPSYDARAENGMAAINSQGGSPYSLPYEFHDRNGASGSIRGYVTGFSAGTVNGTYGGFTVRAYVTNDTPGPLVTYPEADNGIVRRYASRPLFSTARTLYNTVICAEFAGSIGYLDNYGNKQWGKYSAGNVMARNFTRSIYFNRNGVVGYVVPAWHLGDIAPGQTKYVDMTFKFRNDIPQATGLGATMNYWKTNNIDILANRPRFPRIASGVTDNGKMMLWPVAMGADSGTLSVVNFTTASVFHQ
jgi:hypothetical protein